MYRGKNQTEKDVVRSKSQKSIEHIECTVHSSIKTVRQLRLVALGVVHPLDLVGMSSSFA